VTYNVFGGTLSLTQSINQSNERLIRSLRWRVRSYRCYWWCNNSCASAPASVRRRFCANHAQISPYISILGLYELNFLPLRSYA